MNKLLPPLLGLTAVLAGAQLLSGCTKKADSQITELTVWESTGGPDEFIKYAAGEFSKTHPDIRIRFVNVELADSAGQIALDGPAGVGPDLFAAPHDRLGELAEGGHILVVSHPDLVREKALESSLEAVSYGGNIYGYPISADTYALFYNKALITEAELPASFESLIDWVREFNRTHAGSYGFMMNASEGYYTALFTTAGGNRLFEDGVNNEATIKGMSFFQSLRSILDIPSADLTTSICDAAFSSSQAALYISGPWNIAAFEQAGLDFGVAPLPSLPGETDPASSFSGTRTVFVSAYSEHPESAALFAEFLMSDAMQIKRFEITGALPATQIQVESPYIAGFSTQLNHAVPMPSIPAMSARWEALNSAASHIWDGADVKTELDALSRSIASL